MDGQNTERSAPRQIPQPAGDASAVQDRQHRRRSILDWAWSFGSPPASKTGVAPNGSENGAMGGHGVIAPVGSAPAPMVSPTVSEQLASAGGDSAVGSAWASVPRSARGVPGSHHRSNSEASGERPSRSSLAQALGAAGRAEGRARANSISHDEALNLSRAGSSGAMARSASLSAGNRRRSRQGSRYEGMGLVAAFSGGPSSFD